MMKAARWIPATIVLAFLLAGCVAGDGVDKHTGAFHKGCVPVAGGVACTGG